LHAQSFGGALPIFDFQMVDAILPLDVHSEKMLNDVGCCYLFEVLPLFVLKDVKGRHVRRR
jgi:hypothetical protein